MDTQTKKALAKLIIANAEAISDLAKAFLEAAKRAEAVTQGDVRPVNLAAIDASRAYQSALARDAARLATIEVMSKLRRPR